MALAEPIVCGVCDHFAFYIRQPGGGYWRCSSDCRCGEAGCYEIELP